MDYKKLIAFFDDYNAHYKGLLKFEYSKLDMINKDEIEKLSSSLSTEQAFIMKGNTLEAARIKLIGGEQKTFADIIKEAPEEYRAVLQKQYDELSETVLKIKELNDIANDIVTGRLQRIRSKVGELDTYNGKGKVTKESPLGSTMLKNA
ncbi:MAG: flagellar protein FlgN [Ruminococcus sp.]|nr:flagellar protein FlgN [Ruminococcus sp.]